MNILFVILLIVIISYIYLFLSTNKNKNVDENFNQIVDECWIFGNDYNSCYSAHNCTIGFLQDGSTHCMKKFLQENI